MTTAFLRAAAFSLAAAGLPGLSVAARADDSISQINDSMIQQREMDYYGRRGGYMLIQDQNALAVGSRSSTAVVPSPPRPMAVQPAPMMAAPMMAPPVMAAPVMAAPVMATPVVVAEPAYGAGYVPPGYAAPYPNYGVGYTYPYGPYPYGR